MKFYYSIFLLLISLNNISSQSHQEIIKFESANPFSLNDIIENLDLQEKQNVSGKLKLHVDNENVNK